MIELQDATGRIFHLNSELIYRIDRHYDTIITLIDQKTVVVKDEPDSIANKVIAYKRDIYTQMEARK